jgi:hypothetical protein
MKNHLVTPIAMLGLAVALPCQAAIFTLPDITRTAGETAANAAHFDFVTNDGWTGSPPNEILNETSVYLKFTVSWTAAANIGTFLVRFNVNDEGSGARIGAGTDGSGFALINGNSIGDPDGAGPATARPTVDAVDKTAVTSATFVIKVDQTKPTPGGDWWFGNTAQQSGAGHFVYINPDLGLNEAVQSTKWAAWRSGQNGYEGVTFQTDTADVDLNFTNIAIYTGDDTPFSTAVAGVDAATSTVTASPTSVPANGITTSTVTVTLKDASNIPVANKLVSLAKTSGPGTPVIDPATGTTNLFGVTTFTVKSNMVGTEVFTATGDSVVITQTASVDFVSAVTDAGTSTMVTSPGKIAADGAAVSIATVTLKNSLGMPLIGKLVTLAKVSGPGTPVIVPAASGSDTTNANGVATFAVSSTTIGTNEFAATDTSDSVVITQTASVEFADPTIQRGFNVSFVQFTDTLGNFEDPATLEGPAGGLGESWAQIRAASGSNLLASDGTATGVSVTTTYSECRSRSTTGLVMLFDGLTDFGKGVTRTVTISGLTPGSLYDLYLASTADFGAPEERANGTFSTTNATSTVGGQIINQSVAANTTTWEQGNNYVVFENVVVNGSGQINLTAVDTAGFRLPLNGFQLVPASKGRIVSFEAAGNPGVIDQEAFTINVAVPFGTNLATLAPVFAVNSGVCNQTSGSPPSPTFAVQNPATYTVTDDSTDPDTVNNYTVTVSIITPTTTLVIDLGTSPAGTTIEGGAFIGSGPTNLPIPTLPAGSILRSIAMNVKLESTTNDNFANDLAVLLDPTPGSPGGDFSLGITSPNASANFGPPAQVLTWSGGDGGPDTSLAESKTEADWTGDIDLATTGLFLGNAYGGPTVGGTWSGTITLTYDLVGGSPYAIWSGGEAFEDDKNGDGVKNGLAFLLGAANPDENALGRLPVPSKSVTGLKLNFSVRKAADRGAAAAIVQWSNDLGATDLWSANLATVPESTSVVNGVDFQVNSSGSLNVIEATIPSSEGPAGKLFGRLSGAEN